MARKIREEYNAYMKVYVLERYHRRRQEAIADFGGQCVICGSTDTLEFDHIIPSIKLFTIGRMWSLNDKTYRHELTKCQLLCHKCHLSKSKAEGSFGNIVREKKCGCGKIFDSDRSYAGHKTWCKTPSSMCSESLRAGSY